MFERVSTQARQQRIDVVAAVMRRADGRILISQRKQDSAHGGLWEFPGGKREAAESRFDALARELNEELAIDVLEALPLIRFDHRYPSQTINLDVWEVSAWRGRARGAEGQRICWEHPERLHGYAFPAANTTVVNAANLPRIAWVIALSDADSTTLSRLNRASSFLTQTAAAVIVDTPPATRSPEQAASRIEEMRAALTCRLLVDAGSFSRETLRGVAAKSDAGQMLRCARVANRADIARAQGDGDDCILLDMPGESPTGSGAGDWQTIADLVSRTKLPVFARGYFHPTDCAAAIRAGCQGIAVNLSAEFEQLRTTLEQNFAALHGQPRCLDF